MISKQTVYLNAERTKAVKEDDPNAQYLLVREGHEIDPKIVEKYEGAAKLVGDGKAEPASKPETSDALTPQNREDSLPALRTRGKPGKKRGR